MILGSLIIWLESSSSKLFKKCRKLRAMSFPVQVDKGYIDGKKINHGSASSDKRAQTYNWFFSKKHMNSDGLVQNPLPHSGEMLHAYHTLGWQGVCKATKILFIYLLQVSCVLSITSTVSYLVETFWKEEAKCPLSIF